MLKEQLARSQANKESEAKQKEGYKQRFSDLQAEYNKLSEKYRSLQEAIKINPSQQEALKKTLYVDALHKNIESLSAVNKKYHHMITNGLIGFLSSPKVQAKIKKLAIQESQARVQAAEQQVTALKAKIKQLNQQIKLLSPTRISPVELQPIHPDFP